ncbi:hypothetical protein BIV57_06475 [Mangrovactinospora gilvigrisea]|uniref:Uncharacterized protein n=1 Tax=Mangrovactinospora gilvigrisea TaxID=1428644 RepID=A0A1J7CF26_9ACTN|nr:hypothetical protein BIV57_06475 [Mangrovactinospora gilvigrisea]
MLDSVLDLAHGQWCVAGLVEDLVDDALFSAPDQIVEFWTAGERERLVFRLAIHELPDHRGHR